MSPLRPSYPLVPTSTFPSLLYPCPDSPRRCVWSVVWQLPKGPRGSHAGARGVWGPPAGNSRKTGPCQGSPSQSPHRSHLCR
eukprot:9017701-Pyramimonas_sp.AAC.1